MSSIIAIIRGLSIQNQVQQITPVTRNTRNIKVRTIASPHPVQPDRSI